MTSRRRFLAFAFLTILCILLQGCGSSDDPPVTDAGQQPQMDSGSTDSSESAKPPANAAESLTALVAGFRENRPAAIWDFLPETHQREINALARKFAARMDPELWQQTAQVARDSADVLKTRKATILSHPALAESDLAADGSLARNWDGLIALLATIAGSELADLEKMRTFDGGRFFSRFDAHSLAQLKDLSILLGEDNPFSLLPEMIDGASIQLSGETKTAATVQIQPPGGEPREFEFVRVEGKWIPKSWGDELLVDIRRAKSRLDVELAPTVLAQKKKLVMPYLEDAQQILDQLRAAETDAAFHAAMTEKIIKPALLLAAANSNGFATPVDLAGRPGEAVTVIVTRELTPGEIEQIADFLLSGGSADRELTDETANGRTRFVVSPVKDPAAFANTIKFGNVTGVDAEKRTITVELIDAKNPQ